MLTIKQLSQLASDITVLYVEDDLEARELIVNILEIIFPKVLVAHNGLVGIELSKINDIDLVISDINMPKCNGLDMIEAIKKVKPQIVTVLITAHEDSQLLIRSIDLGINKYITKPIYREKLFETIEDMLHLIQSRKSYQNKQIMLSKNLKMIAISKLLNNITHQWRQYLSIISTSSSAIELQYDTQVDIPTVKTLLKTIKNTVNNMDQELQNIYLDSQKEYHKTNFSLQKVTNRVLEFFYQEFKKYNIKVINNIKDITVFNSPESYTQILHYILENSIDALKTDDIEDKLIQIDLEVVEEQIFIEIIDNGGGISNLIIDEIFEPYSTTKHQYIGTGLGLYIAYLLTTKSLNGTLKGTNIICNDIVCTKICLNIKK